MLDLRRRQFITLLGGTAAWPFVAKAQSTGKSWRIGQVIGGSAETNGHFARALEQRLGKLGYRLGGNLVLVTRYASPQLAAMEDAIRRLISEIDLLVAWGTIGAVAAKNVAGSLPVVFLTVGAPVEVGLVQSLSRPGGNMTEITFEAATETYGKRLQLLKEILPNLRNVAVLAAEGDANVAFAMQSLNKAAPELGVTLTRFGLRPDDDIAAKFRQMEQSHAEALIVIAGALTYVKGKEIAELALAHRLPSCHAFYETVRAGGLVSLGPDIPAMAHQGAVYIDKIIHGAKPGELPVQQPTYYVLHINLKTAKRLGVEVSPSLLARADEVIE
jgi:putative tryptophan/tyrosine transport system substrate-binding protein